MFAYDGLPSDLVTDQAEGKRSLKTNSTLSAVSKDITYNIDGTIDTVTEVNNKTGETVIKQMVYNNGKLVGVTATIQ